MLTISTADFKGLPFYTTEPKCKQNNEKGGFGEGSGGGWKGLISTPGTCILALFSGLHWNPNKQVISLMEGQEKDK